MTPTVGETLYRPVRLIRRGIEVTKVIEEVTFEKKSRDPAARCYYRDFPGCWCLGSLRGLLVFAESDPPDHWTHMEVTKVAENHVRAKFLPPDREQLLALFPGPQLDTLGLIQLRRIAAANPEALSEIIPDQLVFDAVGKLKVVEVLEKIMDKRAENLENCADIVNLTYLLKSAADRIYGDIVAGESTIGKDRWIKITQKIESIRADIMGTIS